MNLPTLEKEKGGTGRSLPKVFGKTVFLRADLDVPLKVQSSKFKVQSYIEDDTRLKAGLPTIEYLLKHGAKVIIAGHLGRPENKYQISNIKFQISNADKNSLKPIALWLANNLEIRNWIHSTRSGQELEIGNLNGFEGWQLTDKLFLLENLRFYKGEESNDQEFAKKLASLADIYVNDAFAVSHRAHASIVGVPKYLPHFAGLHLQEEVKILSGVLENPKRPLVVIIGGAKIETKLPLVQKMRDFADYVLVGGKIAKEIVPFLKDQSQTLLVADLNPDGFDITKKSVNEFLKIVNTAKTVVWNGPVGKISNIKYQISNKDSEYGTLKLADGIIKSRAYTVVGGGDTLGFLKQLGLLDKFSFVSTGGGAMLEFLSGKNLPGIIAILS